MRLAGRQQLSGGAVDVERLQEGQRRNGHRQQSDGSKDLQLDFQHRCHDIPEASGCPLADSAMLAGMVQHAGLGVLNSPSLGSDAEG